MRFMLATWSLLLFLRQLMIAHLAIINEGSHRPDDAYLITDITLAQAFYGQVQADEADYYRFELKDHTTLQLSMLVPWQHYTAGFHPTMTLSGPGLPAEGLVMPAEDKGTRRGTTYYQRTQQAEPMLPPGHYVLAVRGDRPGVYCFCCGTREPSEYANDATRARAQALVNSPPA